VSGRLSIRVDGADGAALGFLEIDRVVGGRACGGVRMTASVGPEELARLARIMTLKCGYYGLAAGGAKAGVRAAPGDGAAARAARLEAFGRALAPILATGLYSFGCDLGTTPADIARMRRAAGLGGAEGPAGGGPSSGDLAGLTIALAAVAALRARGIDPRGARVAIQGAGAVGLATARRLALEGARIVAIATVAGSIERAEGFDVATLTAAARREGDAFVLGAGEARAPQAVLEARCDVLVPCAGSGSVDRAAAAALEAAVVVAGANDPFGPGAEEVLHARGALVVPDFVANGGGVLGSTLACAGAGPDEVETVIRRRLAPRVAATIAAALARGEPVPAVAAREALRATEAIDAAYGRARPPSLLPEVLAPRPGPVRRALLALEARSRGSRRLGALGRRLRHRAAARLDEIVAAALAASASEGMRAEAALSPR
jgi:glutamate dehydrogenase (NAD(P)+)